MVIKKYLKKYFSNIKNIKNLKLTKKFKFRIVLVIFLVLLGFFIYLIRGVFVAAIVNGRFITRLSLIKELENQGAKSVLDNLITENIIYQEAKKAGINIEKNDIDKEISSINEELKKQGSNLESALAIQGQKMSDLEKNIKIKLILEKLLSDKITISDKEIEEYFNTNKASFEVGAKLETVKDQIINVLKKQKLSEEYQKWILDLKEKASIKYFINF